jgi:hypothetical protein
VYAVAWCHSEYISEFADRLQWCHPGIDLEERIVV